MEDEESPVLTPSPLNRWNIIGSFIETAGENIVNWGTLVQAWGATVGYHWEVVQERRAFEAAVVTEIEKITEE